MQGDDKTCAGAFLCPHTPTPSTQGETAPTCTEKQGKEPALSAGRAQIFDEDLALVVKTWPILSEPIRAGMWKSSSWGCLEPGPLVFASEPAFLIHPSLPCEATGIWLSRSSGRLTWDQSLPLKVCWSSPAPSLHHHLRLTPSPCRH